MTPVIAVILQDDRALARIGDALERHGLRPVLWHGSGGAHAFIARRRPNLVVLSAPLENREAAIRLIEELCWDPNTRCIPVIVDTERGILRRCAGAPETVTPSAESQYVDDLLQLIEAALAETDLSPETATELDVGM